MHLKLDFAKIEILSAEKCKVLNVHGHSKAKLMYRHIIA